MTDTKTADERLRRLYFVGFQMHKASLDSRNRISREEEDIATNDTAQALLADILALPEMKDEDTDTAHDGHSESPEIYGKNLVRHELRRAITAYFMGGDVGVDMGKSSKTSVSVKPKATMPLAYYSRNKGELFINSTPEEFFPKRKCKEHGPNR